MVSTEPVEISAKAGALLVLLGAEADNLVAQIDESNADRTAVARKILATEDAASPVQATEMALSTTLQMGGTGLEPVTPSLSIRGGRSRPFAGVR